MKEKKVVGKGDVGEKGSQSGGASHRERKREGLKKSGSQGTGIDANRNIKKDHEKKQPRKYCPKTKKSETI